VCVCGEKRERKKGSGVVGKKEKKKQTFAPFFLFLSFSTPARSEKEKTSTLDTKSILSLSRAR
jgi:hypothetical protein